MSELESIALADAVAHLEEAKRALELAAPVEGSLDLLAQYHVATASTFLQMSLKNRSVERARAARRGGTLA